MRFASGTPLAGRYLLLDELSAGPRAAVWRGMDDVLGRPVAVKLYLDAVRDVAARAFIHARARTAARLNHPNATAVYDFGDAPMPGGELLPYVVMELLSGEQLAGRLANGPLDWPLAVRVAAETAGALAASHARGVVHGHVGVAAVMLTPTGAKLLGLAGPGHPPRTPPVPQDDVYGLGRLLWDSLGDLARAPDVIRTACLACVAAVPTDRPAMAEVARTLATEVNRYAATAPADAPALLVPVEPAPTARDRRRPSRAQTVLAAAGALGVLALSGVAARYGDDLLAAATGPSTPSTAPATGGNPTQGNGARPGQTAVQAGPGTTGGPATQGPGAPTTTPSRGADTPGPSSAPAAAALVRLRASVDDGRAAKEITPAAATQLDEAIDDLVRRSGQGENIRGKVMGLHQRIEMWARNAAIAAARATDLRAALDAFEAAVGKPAD